MVLFLFNFITTLPFFTVDHTRVILEDVEGDNTDYINANRIVTSDEGDLYRKEYIATQGCLTGTRADFWQMVWQEQTRVIVMTTKEVERDRPKCVKYWPDLDVTENFGPFAIKNMFGASTVVTNSSPMELHLKMDQVDYEWPAYDQLPPSSTRYEWLTNESRLQ